MSRRLLSMTSQEQEEEEEEKQEAGGYRANLVRFNFLSSAQENPHGKETLFVCGRVGGCGGELDFSISELSTTSLCLVADEN